MIVGVRDCYKSTEKRFLSEIDIEIIFVELILNHSKVLLGSVYRPPNLNFNDFMKKFNAILLDIEKKNNFYSYIAIAGDFNVNYSIYNISNSNFVNLNDCMINSGFSQVICQATYSNNFNCK